MLSQFDRHHHINIGRDINLEGLRILAVDDNEDTLEMIKLIIEELILEEYGVSVTTAKSANVALNLIKQNSFDVLICDLAMPEYDGYWLMNQIKKLQPEQVNLIYKIAITAISGETACKKSIEAGFDEHLTKPIELNEIVTLVDNLIAERLNF